MYDHIHSQACNSYLPWLGTAVAVAYAVYLTLKSRSETSKGGDCGHVNKTVKKDSDKVVDSFDMEDLGNKAVFCRCWRSAKFPYCDGAHNKHNEDTGDNVGPLIVQKKN